MRVASLLAEEQVILAKRLVASDTLRGRRLANVRLLAIEYLWAA